MSFLINQLKKYQTNDLKWACRMSTAGRGLRLHQVSKRSEQNLRTFDTPAEAIIDFIDQEERKV